jgi:tetratricopeptide (TPR) repeat protein
MTYQPKLTLIDLASNHLKVAIYFAYHSKNKQLYAVNQETGIFLVLFFHEPSGQIQNLGNPVRFQSLHRNFTHILLQDRLKENGQTPDQFMFLSLGGDTDDGIVQYLINNHNNPASIRYCKPLDCEVTHQVTAMFPVTNLAIGATNPLGEVIIWYHAETAGPDRKLVLNGTHNQLVPLSLLNSNATCNNPKYDLAIIINREMLYTIGGLESPYNWPENTLRLMLPLSDGEASESSSERINSFATEITSVTRRHDETVTTFIKILCSNRLNLYSRPETEICDELAKPNTFINEWNVALDKLMQSAKALKMSTESLNEKQRTALSHLIIKLELLKALPTIQKALINYKRRQYKVCAESFLSLSNLLKSITSASQLRHDEQLESFWVGSCQLAANTYRSLGEYQSAIAWYDTLLGVFPENALVLSNKGHLLNDYGKFNHAIEHHKEAMLLHKKAISHSAAISNSGILASIHLNYARGFRHLADHNLPHNGLNQLQLYKLAESELRVLFEKNNTYSITHLYQGNIHLARYEILGDDTQLQLALKSYNQALKIQNDHMTAQGFKARVLMYTGRIDEAESLILHVKHVLVDAFSHLATNELQYWMSYFDDTLERINKARCDSLTSSDDEAHSIAEIYKHLTATEFIELFDDGEDCIHALNEASAKLDCATERNKSIASQVSFFKQLNEKPDASSTHTHTAQDLILN